MADGPRATRRALALDLAWITLAKLAADAVVLATGFRAVSDDDFCRVTIAQLFARAPALDPGGPSWLPAPFWVNGGVMALIGRELWLARALAVVLGIAAAFAVYAAARLVMAERREALAGAVVAAVFPWSARLGVATVPELAVAALLLLGAASLCVVSARARLAGAAALLVASLSRFEAWPVAACFGLFTLHDVARRRLVGRRARPCGTLAAALAAAGPVMWLATSAIVRGDAFASMRSVADYKHALGEGRQPWLDALRYPLVFVREEPELALAAIALGVAALVRRRPPVRGAAAARAPAPRRLLVVLGAMALFLMLAALGGGGPTHHLGRALLACWLALAVFVGAGLERAWRRAAARVRLGMAGALAALGLFGILALRPWCSRIDGFGARADEVAIGRAARDLEAGERVLVEVVDYGHYAVMAGSGEPERFELDTEVDRKLHGGPTSFASLHALRARLAESGARCAAGRVTPVTLGLGEPIATAGALGLWCLR